LLEKNIDKINWYNLSLNHSSDAIRLFETTTYVNDKCFWYNLSSNPYAIHLIEQKIKLNQQSDFIRWDRLALNPNAMHLFEQYMDNINWKWITQNYKDIPFLEAVQLHMNKIDWENLSQNPSIFEIDLLQYNISITKKIKNIDCF